MKVDIESGSDLEGLGDDHARSSTRRRFLKSLGAAAAATAFSPLAYAQEKRFDGQTLVYVSWGGVYQDSQKMAYCDPFAAQSGARVIQDGPMNEAKVRTMVAGGSPEGNVCDET